MENIIKLFGALGFLALICVGFVFLLYPIMFEIKFKEIYGKRGISYWWTACQIIGVWGTMSYAQDTSSEAFMEALGFTTIIFVVAMVGNYKRIKKLGLEKAICWRGVLAQLVAPIGVFLILMLISKVFERITGDGEGDD